jgi:hypothetical protein
VPPAGMTHEQLSQTTDPDVSRATPSLPPRLCRILSTLLSSADIEITCTGRMVGAISHPDEPIDFAALPRIVSAFVQARCDAAPQGDAVKKRGRALMSGSCPRRADRYVGCGGAGTEHLSENVVECGPQRDIVLVGAVACDGGDEFVDHLL